MLGKLIELKTNTSHMGSLTFFESNKDISFVKRIYYTYGVPLGSKRGMYAHKNLTQILFCPYGIVDVELDDPNAKQTYRLDAPTKYLYHIKAFLMI